MQVHRARQELPRFVDGMDSKVVTLYVNCRQTLWDLIYEADDIPHDIKRFCQRTPEEREWVRLLERRRGNKELPRLPPAQKVKIANRRGLALHEIYTILHHKVGIVPGSEYLSYRMTRHKLMSPFTRLCEVKYPNQQHHATELCTPLMWQAGWRFDKQHRQESLRLLVLAERVVLSDWVVTECGVSACDVVQCVDDIRALGNTLKPAKLLFILGKLNAGTYTKSSFQLLEKKTFKHLSINSEQDEFDLVVMKLRDIEVDLRYLSTLDYDFEILTDRLNQDCELSLRCLKNVRFKGNALNWVQKVAKVLDLRIRVEHGGTLGQLRYFFIIRNYADDDFPRIDQILTQNIEHDSDEHSQQDPEEYQQDPDE
eukprot:PhF_6_TR25696/c0_g1_i1/m.36210